MIGIFPISKSSSYKSNQKTFKTMIKKNLNYLVLLSIENFKKILMKI